MNIEKYKENNRRKKIIITFMFFVLAIFGGGYYYKTFANFQTTKDFNIISASVADPGDVYFTYHVGDQITNVFPSKSEGLTIDLTSSYCNNGVNFVWSQSKYVLLLDYNNFDTTSTTRTRCDLYFVPRTVYDDGTGASVPELATGMVPIYYDGTTMKVADTSSKWYNYAEHEWANAVLVNVSDNDIKNKYFNSDMTLKTTTVGQTVDINEVQKMYVWIPRYRYQLWNAEDGESDPQAINIVFEDKNESKSAGTKNGD